jgi:hypothetical protein
MMSAHRTDGAIIASFAFMRPPKNAKNRQAPLLSAPAFGHQGLFTHGRASVKRAGTLMRNRRAALCRIGQSPE